MRTYGRSYIVAAGSSGLARQAAREAAARDGHRDPQGTILHVEQLDARRFEVVIEERVR